MNSIANMFYGLDNSIKKFEDSLISKENKMDERLYEYLKK